LTTPGHTPGSICFLAGEQLFSGDTLFPGGPGNTSNPYASFPTIIESIRGKLFRLPDETQVLPGHGKPTTIGRERPHLDEWIQRGWSRRGRPGRRVALPRASPERSSTCVASGCALIGSKWEQKLIGAGRSRVMYSRWHATS